MIITINGDLTLHNIQQVVFLMQIRWIICEVRYEYIVIFSQENTYVVYNVYEFYEI
jgi:hypothetical protein